MESEKQFYGKLGAASPTKRIDPKTGEVVEIISTSENPRIASIKQSKQG
jgi:hypothetical protein